ncbi:hypothetical protein UMNF18_1865 [Escherichia coli UMNF18]|nr:hypothetical protein UMNF18_1865 [Escherichia coli UMNF18]EII44044.1 hypothetical protein EC23916_2226 [Escherichia coli 2.3916]
MFEWAMPRCLLTLYSQSCHRDSAIKSKPMFEFIEQRIESRDVVLYIYHLKEN